MFDKADIRVKAGDGGDGSVNFRREKFVPFGGPDGGDGGDGGSVVVRADREVDDLRNYRHKRSFTAERGLPGGKNRKHGKSGADLILRVPTGTIVTGIEVDGTRTMLGDLKRDGEEIIVAKGGRGGMANVHFTSSINQAPHIAQRGEEGEERRIGLEMRLIADVGIIGYPNAGKSTLLTAASAAKPKVADYPFTTLEPVLGVVEIGQEAFVLAEIPGLIEGAHTGKGLGHEFLRHAMRTRIFIHLIGGDAENPIDDMLSVNDELVKYDPTMAARPQIVAVNKTDIPDVKERLKEIRKELTEAGVKAHYISANTREGVDMLMAEALALLKTVGEPEQPVPEEEIKVFRPKPKEERYRIIRELTDEGMVYLVEAPELERLYVAAGAGPGELKGQIVFQLQRMGAWKELEKMGIQKGDLVKSAGITWVW